MYVCVYSTCRKRMRPWCPCARGSSPGSVLRSSGNCPSDPCTRQEQWCRVQSVHTRLPFEINRLVVVFIINDFDVFCFVCEQFEKKNV